MPDTSPRSLPLAPVVIVLVMVAAGAFAFLGCGDDDEPPGEHRWCCEDGEPAGGGCPEDACPEVEQ